MQSKDLLSYDAPEIKIIFLNDNDIITTSLTGDDMDSDGWTST